QLPMMSVALTFVSQYPTTPHIYTLSLHDALPILPLVLERFSPDEVSEQLAAILDAAPAQEVADRIVERSSGIPFFVEELAASLDALDRIPRGLEELLRARVDALSAEAQQLVRAVAAGTAGGPVPDAVLASVVGWEPVELAARLREAVTRYVLVVSDDSYDFRHALMREVVEADLLPGERAALHAAFARALETLDEGAGDDPATANRIALHLLAAHDLPG